VLFGEQRGDEAVQRSSERMLGRVAIGFGSQLLVGALWAGGVAALLVAAVLFSHHEAGAPAGALPWVGAVWAWIGGVTSALGALAGLVLYEQITVHERAKEHALTAELREARRVRDAAAAAALAARESSRAHELERVAPPAPPAS
jgi:hypothetical protein